MMAYEESFAFRLLQKFESMRDRIENYIAVVDLCPLPAFITSKEGGAIIYVNSAYRKLLGVVEEDLQELNWLRVIHPDDEERVKKVWLDFVANNKTGVPEASYHRYRNVKTGFIIPCVTFTTCVANNGIVGYIVPTDCVGLLVLGVDLQCEVQKAKLAATAGYDPATSALTVQRSTS